MSSKPKIEYLKKNFEEISILAVLTRLALDELIEPTIDDEMVIQAFRRSKTDLHGASLEEIGNYLSNMDEDSIGGVVSNVKGILHEMEWVAMENSDGDSVVIGMFPDTNHKDYDIWALDTSTGEQWVEQIKTTENSSYVKDWINDHPDGTIRVNQEMAEKLGLPSTGIDNDQLEYRVEDVVDKLQDLAEDDTLWDYFPTLSAISIAIVVWTLHKRYKQGIITSDEFKWMAVKTTGQKVIKIATLMVLLSLPIINIITGTVLIFNLIQSGQEVLDNI